MNRFTERILPPGRDDRRMLRIATRLQPTAFGTPSLRCLLTGAWRSPLLPGLPLIIVVATPPAPVVEVLATAVVFSLFTERRAGRDDSQADGNAER